MQTQADLLVGDTLLSAACIAYYGAFTGPFRAGLVATWVARCNELGVPASSTCMLRTLLAPPAEVPATTWQSKHAWMRWVYALMRGQQLQMG